MGTKSNYVEKHMATSQLALQTPIINYRDGFGCSGQNGKHIDKDSFLKYNSVQTSNGSKITLPQVGFLTVPFMGNGCPSVNKSPRLDFEYSYSPKSTLTNGEKNRFVPLVGCIANEIQNTNHIIPEDMHSGWFRGGYPSRGCKNYRGLPPKPLETNICKDIN